MLTRIAGRVNARWKWVMKNTTNWKHLIVFDFHYFDIALYNLKFNIYCNEINT